MKQAKPKDSLKDRVARLERELLEARTDILRVGLVLGTVVSHQRVPITLNAEHAERLLSLKPAPPPPAKSLIIVPTPVMA